MFGRGNSSLRQAQLRILKSTKHLIYSFFFLTNTILDNLWCWIGLMNSAATSFYTSCTICAIISMWNTLATFAIGLVPTSTLSVCTTKIGSSPSISPYSHTNISLNSLCNWIKLVFSSSVSYELIVMGPGFYRSSPKFTSSSFSSADTCSSFSIIITFSSSK